MKKTLSFLTLGATLATLPAFASPATTEQLLSDLQKVRQLQDEEEATLGTESTRPEGDETVRPSDAAHATIMWQHVPHTNDIVDGAQAVGKFFKNEGEKVVETTENVAKDLRGAFVKIKSAFRIKQDGEEATSQKAEGREGWDPRTDYAGALLDADGLTTVGGKKVPKIQKLAEMDSKKLTESKLAEASQPWSDYYWAVYAGVAANRYADPKAPFMQQDQKYTDYVKYLVDNKVSVQNASSVDSLSPAEKYDLLVGDQDFTLTKYMISQGEQYSNGGRAEVETWMGICHGWSPAAYEVVRPKSKQVFQTSIGGRKYDITFYPSDIKALATSLWAAAQTPSRFVGSRCNEKSPATEPNGRIKDAGCRDTNPGTWHLAVVNQISQAKQSFVIDATYDYEVWNQPVLGYKYTYFNPETGAAAPTLAAATVKKGFAKDKFGKTRNAETTTIVGVNMDLTYIAETVPSHQNTDSAAQDASRTVSFMYDLELNAAGEIVGGEWYNVEHPDFMWTPGKGIEALSVADRAIHGGIWDGKSPIDAKNLAAIKKASIAGQPMWQIVKNMAALSAAGITTRPSR